MRIEFRISWFNPVKNENGKKLGEKYTAGRKGKKIENVTVQNSFEK